jgi:hypothetical protein
MILTETFLASDEVQGLTNKSRKSSQILALRSMGIEHRVRPDGSVAVLRAHIIKLFGGDIPVTKAKKTNQPNWNAV